MYSYTPGPVKESPCTSDLTYSRQALSVAYIEQKSPSSKRTTKQSVQFKKSAHDHGISPSGFIAKADLAISKKSTFFFNTDTSQTDSIWLIHSKEFLQKRKSHYTLVRANPVHPAWQVHQWISLQILVHPTWRMTWRASVNFPLLFSNIWSQYIPKWFHCKGRFGHQQEVHILLQHRHISQMDSIWLIHSKEFPQKIPLYTCARRSSTPCLTGTSIDQFANPQPTHLKNDLKGRC